MGRSKHLDRFADVLTLGHLDQLDHFLEDVVLLLVVESVLQDDLEQVCLVAVSVK